MEVCQKVRLNKLDKDTANDRMSTFANTIPEPDALLDFRKAKVLGPNSYQLESVLAPYPPHARPKYILIHFSAELFFLLAMQEL